ncbi:GNAT family N-acetyltransferase [Aminobacter niigataensis]|uniref:GNAT family N-acetyltransferase n=1 Tax=Aminobacter niigataensis TaxID=83265 RepID=UPI0024CBC4CF|nr:GNAT family N-acetyltransferase [Aminobacter niigataensis]CAI2934167.1 Acetyltransf_6 domain-containing protein [Aminobacter niigataensis]
MQGFNVAHSQKSLPAPAISLEPHFDFLSDDYARLYAASDATAFQHPLWLDSFYRRLAEHRGAEKIVITGRDAATHRLVFVLPMIRRRHTGVTLLESCDLGVSDYAAPVAAPALLNGPKLAPAIHAALPAYDILRIRPVRAEHVAVWQALLGGEARKLDFSAHAAVLQGDFAAWRETALDGSFRRILDRKKKRFLKQQGAGVRLLSESAEIRTGIAHLARLRAGRFDGDLIQATEVERFYTEVAVNGAATGFARTYEIAIGDEKIGYAFGIAAAGRFNYLLIGCDYGVHGRHSPGLILYDRMIEDWIANDGKIYDFTIGDEPFKKQFGTVETPIWMVCENATWRGRLGAAAFAAREQLRRLRNKADEPGNSSGKLGANDAD